MNPLPGAGGGLGGDRALAPGEEAVNTRRGARDLIGDTIRNAVPTAELACRVAYGVPRRASYSTSNDSTIHFPSFSASLSFPLPECSSSPRRSWVFSMVTPWTSSASRQVETLAKRISIALL